MEHRTVPLEHKTHMWVRVLPSVDMPSGSHIYDVHFEKFSTHDVHQDSTTHAQMLRSLDEPELVMRMQ